MKHLVFLTNIQLNFTMKFDFYSFRVRFKASHTLPYLLNIEWTLFTKQHKNLAKMDIRFSFNSNFVH